MHVQVHVMLINNLFHTKKICLKDSYAYMSSNERQSYYTCYTDYTLDGGNHDFFMKCYQHIFTIFLMGHDVFFQLSRMVLFTYVVHDCIW